MIHYQNKESHFTNKIKEEIMEYTKNDWKLFRVRIVDWQEAYMDKLNKEYIALLNADANASDKFWELEKRIRKDKRKPGVILKMSKQDLIIDLVSLINDNVIGMEDLEEFSDGLKETVKIFIGR
jgi:hypothetical protein